MVVFLLITGLVISLSVNIGLIIIIRNMAAKVSIYEEWISNYMVSVEKLLNNLREIDSQGVFASSMNASGMFEYDDQVGHIFKELQTQVDEFHQNIQ